MFLLILAYHAFPYMEVNIKDVLFHWLNTEMIGILRQLKYDSTKIEISQTGTQRVMLV